ncbi:hypothetical protein HG530_002584 [Fusarium avenaceum]|nr:hypothetical protein HG530_002584 [Fusarium avenaceum]
MAASDVRIETITNPEDFTGAFKASANAFGHQTKDAVWMAFNPGWDTPEGVKVGAQRMANRFSSITKNRDGQPNTVFVKATLGDTIAGLAIWQQASVVDGFGDAPKDLDEGGFLEKLYPGNEAEQRFLAQAHASLFGRRREIIKGKASASPPAVFVMDLCAVDPQFQRRGIARKLVQWGLDEAGRRALLIISFLHLLTRPESPLRNTHHQTALKHKRTASSADLDRLELCVPRTLVALCVRPVTAHNVVQTRASGHETPCAATLGVVAALDEAHELAHGVAVVPRWAECVFADEPSRWEDYEVGDCCAGIFARAFGGSSSKVLTEARNRRLEVTGVGQTVGTNGA